MAFRVNKVVESYTPYIARYMPDGPRSREWSVSSSIIDAPPASHAEVEIIESFFHGKPIASERLEVVL